MPRTFVLRDETIVNAPLDRCFLLSTNIKIVARTLKMRPTTQYRRDFVQGGDRVCWRGWRLGMPQLHESLIEPFVPPVHFRDSMLHGRFASFAHDHRFTELRDGHVRLWDEVRFQMPFGWIGELVGRRIIVPHIRRLLRKRFTLLRQIAESEEWREYLPEVAISR